MVAVYHIIQSGLLGAIFITNNPAICELGYVTTPSVVVNTKDEPALIDYAWKSAKTTVSLNFQQTLLKTKPAPAVALYTSTGPSKSYPGLLKSDIMALGSLVLAAWSPKVASVQIGFIVNLPSDYNLISGTSMACPHASDVAELLKGAHPGWSATAIRSALMTTANPLDTTCNPILDDGDNFNSVSPLAMGTGHIDPNRALEPGIIYDATLQEYINLLCSNNFTQDCDKCVGDGVARYMALVIAPKGYKVTVSPEILIFAHKYEKEKGKALYGTLVWIEQNQKYSVRSSLV